MRGRLIMATFFQDLRYGTRQLRLMPVFALVAIGTLALGIGANTAVFSVMNAIMLRSLPVPNPEQLVMLRYGDNQPKGTSQTGHDDTSLSQPVFEQLRNSHDVFSDLVAFVPLTTEKAAVRFGSEPESAGVDMVSGNFFSGLGVSIVRGRGFTLDDEKNHTQTAVLSYGYWTSRFGRNPSVLGQTLFIKSVPFTIIGVAAPGFDGLERGLPTDAWIPLQSNPNLKPWGTSAQDEVTLYNSPKWFFLMMIGRLAPGVTKEQALAKLNPIYVQTVYSTVGNPEPNAPKPQLTLSPVRGIEGLRQQYEQPLKVLMAMVGLILVIACSNVAMLLIARNAARQREFSVRLALGGSARHLFIQLFSESMLLVVSGACLGWIFSVWATRALASWSQLQVDVAPDRIVLLFTIAVSILVSLVFGLAPLRGAATVSPGLALRASATTAQQDRGRVRGAQIVLASQMALCLALLVTTGLLVRTLRNLGSANLGMKTEGLLVFGITPPPSLRSDAETIQFFQKLMERMRVLPGVESATLMGNRLGSGWSNNTGTQVDGVNPLGNKFAEVRWNLVGPDYFHVLGTGLVMGRDFTEADSASAPRVMIINQTYANRYLHNANPLGHHVGLQRGENDFGTPYTIIGVAANSKYTEVREKPKPMAYVPYTQVPGISTMHIELRTPGNPLALLPEVRRVVQEFGPDLVLLQPTTQQKQFESSYSDQRIVSRLSMFFGLLAALLVATGLYGNLAYRVNRRTAEIGLRMALGAQRQQVLWMVLRESLVLCLIGAIVGLPLAFAAARWLKSMLFGISPADPLSFVLALVGIALVATIAGFLPAQRASSVNPMVALRYE
jgi:predicted permease